MKNNWKELKIIDILEMVAIILVCAICCSAMTVLMPIRIIMIMLLGMILPLWSFFKNNSIVLNRFTIPMIFFLGLLFIGVLYSLDRIETIKFGIVFFAGTAIMLVKLSDDFFYKILNILKIIIFIIGISILLNAMIPNLFIEQLNFLIRPGMEAWLKVEVAGHIYSGMTGEKGEAALLMVIGVALGLSNLVSHEKLNWKNIIYLTVVTIALILPAKRMLFAIGIFFFLIYALLWTSRSKKIVTFSILLLVIVVAVAFSDYIPGLNVLMERFTEGGEDTSLNGRSYLWERAIQMFRNKPVFGYGYGSYNTFASYYGVRTSGNGKWSYFAHNVYLELFAEMGIVGSILIITPIVTGLILSFYLLFKKCIQEKKDREILFFTQCMQICFFIYNFTGNCLYNTNQIIMYLLVIAMIAHLYEKYKSQLVNIKSNHLNMNLNEKS